MSKREQLKEYLYTKVNSIVERMVIEILKHKPENIHDFMINYLQNDKENQKSEVTTLAVRFSFNLECLWRIL